MSVASDAVFRILYSGEGDLKDAVKALVDDELERLTDAFGCPFSLELADRRGDLAAGGWSVAGCDDDGTTKTWCLNFFPKHEVKEISFTYVIEEKP